MPSGPFTLIRNLNPHHMKTHTVRFSNATCRDAALLIPAEPASLYQVSELIVKSYLDYMFSGACLMSDEVLVSSIGKSNFFEGALGGWETRLSAKDFAALKNVLDDTRLAVDVVRYRDDTLSRADAYRIAAKNEALSEADRKSLRAMAAFAERAAGVNA